MISIVQLLLEVSIEKLKDQFVRTGRMTEELFSKIEDVCNHKSAYITWMVSRVADGMIPEDLVWWVKYGYGGQGGNQIFRGPAFELGKKSNY